MAAFRGSQLLILKAEPGGLKSKVCPLLLYLQGPVPHDFILLTL